MRRLILFFVLAATAVAVLAAPAAAGQTARDRFRDDDRRINVSGGVVIGEDETVTGEVVSFDGDVLVLGTVENDIFVGRGDLVVDGTVRGDILVLRGDATVSDGAVVRGDIAVIDGRVITQDGAEVSGDVKSRKEPRVAPNTVTGDVEKINLTNAINGIVIAFLIFLWIATTISVAILGILFIALFPRAADATVAAGKRFWASLGMGVLVGIGLPIVAVFVLATVIGIPIGVGIFSGLTILGPLGYVVASLELGRLMVKGPSGGARFGAFFAGFGILRLVALIPGIGFIVWYVASLYGLGAIVIAAWRAGHGSTPAAPPAPEATPAEPPTEPAPAVDPAPKPEPEASSDDADKKDEEPAPSS
jgi:cytoskeletal protein CcmA (bactofilin family)